MARGRVISAVLTLKDRDFTKNAKKATSALNDTERRALHARNTVSKFGESASSSFRRAAESAVGIASAIGVLYSLNAAINMIRGSLDTAFSRIDTMEQFERTMTTLTGSTEEMNVALEKTDAIVSGTGYALDTAAKGVQDFVTRGMDVEQATFTMEAFADAVAFYGDGSNEQLASVTDALAKMYTTGKVQMDQMNRLFDAGIDAVGMYAQAVGRDAESVQKDLSSGAISAEEFIDVVSTAMMEGTNGVVNIAGTAQEAGASWGATWGNMRIYVARGVASIIKSIDEMLVSNGLPDMRTMVSNFGKTFEGVLNSAAEKVPAVTDWLVGMYDRAKPGIDWMKDTGFPAVRSAIETTTEKAREIYNFIKDNWSLIGPVVAGIAATVASFRVGIIAVTAATKTWGIVTSAVQVATAVLNGTLAVSPLGWIALAIGAVVAAGIALWQNWDTITEKASNLWNNLKKWFGDLKNNIVRWFGEMKDSAVEKFEDIIQAAKDLPGKIDDGIKQFASDAWEGIKDLAKGLIDRFKEALGIKSPSKVFFDMAKWIVEGLVNGLSASNLKELGKNLFGDFLGGVFDTFDKIRGFLSGSGAGGDIKSWIAQAIAITGVPSSWAGALETIAKYESGGNPRAINLWDINAQRGIPSKGLMQTIDPTFNAYKLPGMDDIWNPVHNAVAAIRYIQSRYGTVFNTPGIKSMASGGGYRGYWRGGTVPYGQRILVGERGPELMDVPGGTRVHNNYDSKRMMGNITFGDIIINGTNLTADQIVNELIIKLKTRLANM